MSCDHNCFNCMYSDCISNNVSDDEMVDSKSRDVSAILSDADISRKKKYYYEHHEHSKRYAREYYHRNKAKQNAKSREYYHKHKDKFKEYNKRWKEEHKELVKQRQHQYYLNWKRKKEQK